MKLQNLINPELALTVKDNAVTLEEAQTEKGTLRDVTVHGLPNNVFVFSTDKKITVSTDRWEKRRNQFLNDENDKIHKNYLKRILSLRRDSIRKM
jgi:light-regulated signal transduction histidine kinase (bacteriophytochrome)